MLYVIQYYIIKHSLSLLLGLAFLYIAVDFSNKCYPTQSIPNTDLNKNSD